MGDDTQLHIVREGVPFCVHHWILSDPEADITTGRCKRCAGERVFCPNDGIDRSHDARTSQAGVDIYTADKTG